MKIIYILPISLLIACSNDKEQTVKEQPTALNENQIDKSEEKEILIYSDEWDSYSITESEINNYRDYFRLSNIDEFVKEPELVYEGRKRNNDDIEVKFISEVGIDNFYLFYSYELKQQNGVDEFRNERDTLLKIYNSINSLYSYLENGGTYFGHMKKRMQGVAEYSIYALIRNEYYSKNHDIENQKKYFLLSLKEYCKNEVRLNTDLLEEEKKDKLAEIDNRIIELGGYITKFFYMRNAQSFRYKYY